MAVIKLPNNWKPRPYQRKVWKYWEDGGRQANLIWHRRAGKDEICLHRTAVAAFERPGTYWHMLPEAAHARKAIWTSINPHTGKRRIDEAFPHALRKTTREQEMFIEFVNGSTWQVGGSDRYNSLVGSSPAGVVFSEWALANPAAWGYVRPMLLENGGWSVFITTPRGHNHAEKMHKAAKNVPGAFAQILTASESGVFTPEQLKGELQALIDEHGPDFGQSLFDQEYFCSFDAAILGSYYGAWITKLKSEGRVRNVAIDPALPVHSAWDLGFSDDTSIWFYQVPYGEVHFVGCYSASGMGIDHYIDYLERYYSERGCKRGAIYLPHDARAKTFASGGKSAEEQLAKAFGWSNIRIVPSLSVQDGIQAAREMLKRSYFDVECEDGLEALAQYQREWDDNKKCFRESPKHDWTSHCFVGETSVLTRHGTHQIMDLPYSGEVMTPCGWKQYENPRITRKAAPLVEVRFVGGHTVKCTPDHLFWTESGWISAESLTKGSKIQSSLTRSRSISMAASIAFGRVSGIFRKAAAACIETFGALRLGRFLMDATFTTKTRTQRTTPLITWSAYRQPSITQSQNSEIPVSLLKPGWPPQTGIDPRKGENGTGSMRQSLKAGKNGSASQSLATIAARYLTRWFVKAGIRKDSATSYAKPLHIESVKPLDEVADVWCITVPDGEWFSLANGAVVHNCADAFRMAAVAYAEEAKTAPKPDPKFPMQQSIDQLIAAQRRKRMSEE